MIVCVLLKPAARALEVAIEHFPQRSGSVKPSYGARPVQLMADIMKPDDFAVGRVKKRNVKAVEVKWIVGRAARVSFGLGEDILRTEGESLRFNDAEQNRVNVQRVIGRPVVSLVLFDSALRVVAQASRCVEGSYGPPGASKLRIDSRSSSLPLILQAHDFFQGSV